MSFMLGVFLRVAVLVALAAFLLTLPQLSEYRTSLLRLLSTCPLHWFRSPSSDDSETVNVIRTQDDPVFTKDQLAMYDGSPGSQGLMLAILGRVYDVSSGSKHYGPGGGYHFFSGKDGTKAFMTGAFNIDGLIDSVEGLSSLQMIELHNWILFYDKTYLYKGKLVGNFYDTRGQPTQALRDAQTSIDVAFSEKNDRMALQQIFPNCNSQWSDTAGTTLWCSNKSGGVIREWEGVPRKYFEQAAQNTRCACVRTTGSPSFPSQTDTGRGDLDHPGLSEYENCDPTASSCYIGR